MSTVAFGRPNRGRYERPLLGAAGVVTVLGVWTAAVQFELVNSALIGTPQSVLQAGIREIQDGRIWPYALVSLTEFASGFGIAVVVGIVSGIVAGWHRGINRVAEPWIAAMYATPHVALVPLIILWLGIGLVSKTFIVFLFAVFPIVINTMIGVKGAEAAYLQVAQAFGASRWQLFRSVILPGSVPMILTGVRLGAGRALVGVVVAELVAANEGIGFLISLAGSTLNTPLLLFAIMIIGIFGVTVAESMRLVERRFEKWRP